MADEWDELNAEADLLALAIATGTLRSEHVEESPLPPRALAQGFASWEEWRRHRRHQAAKQLPVRIASRRQAEHVLDGFRPPKPKPKPSTYSLTEQERRDHANELVTVHEWSIGEVEIRIEITRRNTAA